MRTWQLEILTEDELALLAYIVNVAQPIVSPKFEVTKTSHLLMIRHEALLWKCAQQEKNLTDEGRIVFTGLMSKLNMDFAKYLELYEHSKKSEYTQPEFQF